MLNFRLIAAAAAVSMTGPALAVGIDGSIDAADGWTAVFTGSQGVEVFIQSDANSLYFAGRTDDDDDGQANTGGFDDAFNINFGLDGNAAAWRYRLLSENQSFNDNKGSSTPFDGEWEGFLQGGDDSMVANAAFGVPDDLTNLDANKVDYAVSVVNGVREHEFAIPWTLLLDGKNGWVAGTLIDLRIGGFYGKDGRSFGLGVAPGGHIDFGDQSTYALAANTPAAIPVPAALPLLASGLVALGALARRRTARA